MKQLLIVSLLCAAALLYAQDNMQAPAAEKHSAAHAAGAAAFKAEVQKLADEWKAGYDAKDVDKVAALYTDDAVWINPDGTFHGTGDIKGELKKMLDRGDIIDNLKTTRAVRSGDLGIAQGTYTGKAPSHGYWAVTLKNQDGNWRLASDSSLEAAGAGGMAKQGKKSN
jgi:uncharacterized protein (TIGR02246 family)